MALRAGYYGIKRRLLDKILPDYTTPGVLSNQELTDTKLDKNSIRVSGVSVDDLTTAGIYYCAGQMTGLPYGSIGTMIVIKSPVNTYQQIYIPAGDSTKVYIRRFWENTWSTWALFTGTVLQSSKLSDDVSEEIVKDEIKDPVVEKKTTTRKKSTAKADTTEGV